ncbi:ankyrin repeat domain-containing protein [Patescibacteria group bacterium]|nr:ankyrin repeat domain-containing protein [Desulfobacteraceae bacterium]MBU4000624.1 ankyrin repeat domain-containing protein [Patescibacteria group bacterium]
MNNYNIRKQIEALIEKSQFNKVAELLKRHREIVDDLYIDLRAEVINAATEGCDEFFEFIKEEILLREGIEEYKKVIEGPLSDIVWFVDDENVVCNNHLEIAKLLLSSSTVDIVDEERRNLLDIFADRKAMELTDIFLESKSKYFNFNWLTKKKKAMLDLLLTFGVKYTNLSTAAAFGSIDDIKRLAREGNDLEFMLPHREWTPLHFAAANGNADILIFLLEEIEKVSDDKNPTDWVNDLTPYDMAINQECKELLISYGHNGVTTQKALDKYDRELTYLNKEFQKNIQLYFDKLPDDFKILRRRFIPDNAIYPNNWDEIFSYLVMCLDNKGDKNIPSPPVPWILAGSCAPDVSKFERFNEIIMWSQQYNFLDELEYMISQNKRGYYYGET